MSLVIEKFLICDGGCSETLAIGVDNRWRRTLKSLLAEARKEGWRRVKGKDYCTVCLKDRAVLKEG